MDKYEMFTVPPELIILCHVPCTSTWFLAEATLAKAIEIAEKHEKECDA